MEDRLYDESEAFMKPSQSFYDSFKDCKTRRLLPVTGIGREEFLREAESIINDAADEARRSGLSHSEVEQVRTAARRRIAEGSLFYFVVMILDLGFVNTDYGYRLCLDVQYNKWKKLWVIAREHLKDLACDTPILTTKGWKNHGDLVPGDVVFTPKGTSHVVAVRHFTDSHCRKVNFRGNNSIVCGNGHLWKAFRKINGEWKEEVCETSVLMESEDVPYIQNGQNKIYIQSIDEYETVPTNCIQIADPDGIYLAGKSLIPTHNSTIITEASTLWEIINDPNQTYCIYSYKADMAMKFLNVIRGWIENNKELRAMWPDIFWENPALGYEDTPKGRIRWCWTASAIDVKRTINSKEHTIEIGGIQGSSKTGAHFSRQIFDDTETQKNVETPEAIDKLFSQTLMAFNTGQTEHLEFCFVGTFYARADVYYRMLKADVFDEGIIQPCTDDRGVSIYFTKDALEEKYRLMGPETFATQMMCDPSFNSVATFKAEWVRRWNPKTSGLNIYIVVDPASGKTGKRHDYTVMIVFGIDSMGNILIIDMIRDKIGLESKFLNLSSLVMRYSPIRVYYEQVSMQQDISSLEMLMDKYSTRFPIIPFSPAKWGDKGARIEKLRNMFEYMKIYLPERCIHKNYEDKEEDVISSFYYEEYLGYPSVPHDDALDCMASAVMLFTDGELQKPASMLDTRKTREREALDDEYSPYAYAVTGNSYTEFEPEPDDFLDKLIVADGGLVSGTKIA